MEDAEKWYKYALCSWMISFPISNSFQFLNHSNNSSRRLSLYHFIITKMLFTNLLASLFATRYAKRLDTLAPLLN